MYHRPLGQTGLQIPAIVFGAGAVGGAVFNGPMGARTAIVRKALDRGIDWFDTASSYGDGQSEENLGRILRELDATPSISTKVRLGDEDLGDIPEAIARSAGASLERLRQPSVELLQLHNRIGMRRGDAGQLSVEDVLGSNGIAEGLERAREAGLTRLIGFTALGDTDALHALIESGRFDTVQAYHNILNPSASREVPAGFSAQDYHRLIPAAAERGMGALNIRTLAAGAVAGGTGRAGARPLSPGSDGETDMARSEAVEAALSAERGTIARKAIRFALMTSGVSAVLVGFSTAAEIDEAVDASEMPPLGDDALAALDALYASDFRPA